MMKRKKADMMKWADRKVEGKKKLHKPPDKEGRPMRGKGLVLLVIIT
jgi:hypothetical protein